MKEKKKHSVIIFLLVMGLLTACSSDDDNKVEEQPKEPEQQEELRPNPSPYDVKIDGICYKLVHKSGIARVVSGDVYYAGNVVIPQTIENEGKVYRVEEMADSAFCGCKNLTSVLIPNTITKIGKWMFKDCCQLKSVALPEGLEKLPPECSISVQH